MTKIAGIILRAIDRKETEGFYRALGLKTQEHQHGGPLHSEIVPMTDGAVVEIYQASPSFPQDALMIEVESIDQALGVAVQYGIAPAGEQRETLDMKFIYIADPDGRSVMLIEKK